MQESILVEEILRYLPSLSMNTKVGLLCAIYSTICEEFCKQSSVCIGCPLLVTCQSLQAVKDNWKEENRNKENNNGTENV